MPAWAKSLPIVVLMAMVASGCTSAPAKPVAEATPSASASSSSTASPASDVGAVCSLTDGHTGDVVATANLAVQSDALDFTMTSPSSLPYEDGFELYWEVATPSRQYDYGLDVDFSKSGAEYQTLSDSEKPSSKDQTPTATVDGRSVSSLLPLSQIPEISTSHFLWSASIRLGNHWISCPKEGSWSMDPKSFNGYPAGSGTSPTPGDAAAGPAIVRKKHEAAFFSPSGNLQCEMSPNDAYCYISKYSWTMPPKPNDCNWDWAAGMELNDDQVITGRCTSDGTAAQVVLPYGHGYQVGNVLCMSQKDGVLCQNQKNGAGFLLSRDKAEDLGAATASPTPSPSPSATASPTANPTVRTESTAASFQTPNGNIDCDMAASSGVHCYIKNHTWKPPKVELCTPNSTWSAEVSMAGGPASETGCTSGPRAVGDTLAYGYSIVVGSYRCDSTTNGVTCINEATGHGFVLSRSTYNPY